MRIINKKVGQTPLEALEIFRNKDPLLKDERLSYIGRLDPMAEGKMVVLIGEKENKDRSKYLTFDKEYIADFLIGVSTDSLDILGLITKTSNNTKRISIKDIKCGLDKIKRIKEQKYPWFSGKTINGIKMFDIYKSGKTTEVERPTEKVKIYHVSDPKLRIENANEVYDDILKRIKRVNGNFRQKETVEKWNEYFTENKKVKFKIFSFSIKVSSGTFIRGLAENFEKHFKLPVLLYKLKRTKLCKKDAGNS